MYTLHILKNGKVTKHEVDTAKEIKAIFDANKGAAYRLYQRDTTTYHSPKYVQILLKGA